MVEDIERIGTQLHANPARHRERLHDRQIGVDEGRADHDVAAEIAEPVDGRERRRVEPLIHRADDPDRTGLTSGRTVLGTPFRLLLLVTMLTGLPLWAWTIAATCQPRVSACPVNGSS